MKRAAFVCNDPGMIDKVFGQGRGETLKRLACVYPEVVTEATFARHAPELGAVEVIFSTWGFWSLSAEQLAALPALKAVFYAAGSVKVLAGPLLDRGIVVMSAWAANAVPVAEFALAQILLANKGYFRNSQEYHDGKEHGACFRGPGNFSETVALLGCGQIARKLIELLKPFNLRIVVVDPHLDDTEAAVLGVRKAELPEAFARAFVISSHLPNLPELRGVLNRPLFESMRPGAVFINTGRGAQVNESDLVAVLRQRPDQTALLDVTDPEPVPAESPLRTLPNVRFSSHIAGAMNDEVVRMADYAIEEFQAWLAGQPLRYQVTREMLARMA